MMSRETCACWDGFVGPLILLILISNVQAKFSESGNRAWVYSSIGKASAEHAQSSGFDVEHHTNPAWWCTAVISAL